MNLIALALVAGSLCHAAPDAASPLAPGLGAGPRIGDVFQVEAACASPADAQRLAEAGYDVDGVRPGSATLFATAGELANLRAAGWKVAVVSEPAKAPQVPAGYHTYDTLTSALYADAAAYPSICRLESLGQSVLGRDIWAMRITDHPDAEEQEPEFKYIGSIHGNEPPGMEMCLRFIEYLLAGYGPDERATALVDSTDIWIVPLMNPDGLQSNTRYNAHGYDLNRSFPVWPSEFSGTLAEGVPADTSGREPEVAAIMQWTAAHRFVLSANFHSGSLVVNYPYDDDGLGSVFSPTPDEDLFETISLRYAMYNAPMYASPEFTHGVTNGAAWYAISGGMQDWNYRYAGCNEVTIELSNTYAPLASTLNTLWDNNRESMLSYLDTVHWGVCGVATDAYTGEPVSARIRIEGNPQWVSTDPQQGDFYRMLLPGAYTVTVEAQGYDSAEFCVTIPEDHSVQAREIGLMPQGPLPSMPLAVDSLISLILVTQVLRVGFGSRKRQGQCLPPDGDSDVRCRMPGGYAKDD